MYDTLEKRGEKLQKPSAHYSFTGKKNKTKTKNKQHRDAIKRL